MSPNSTGLGDDAASPITLPKTLPATTLGRPLLPAFPRTVPELARMLDPFLQTSQPKNESNFVQRLRASEATEDDPFAPTEDDPLVPTVPATRANTPEPSQPKTIWRAPTTPTFTALDQQASPVSSTASESSPSSSSPSSGDAPASPAHKDAPTTSVGSPGAQTPRAGSGARRPMAWSTEPDNLVANDLADDPEFFSRLQHDPGLSQAMRLALDLPSSPTIPTTSQSSSVAPDAPSSGASNVAQAEGGAEIGGKVASKGKGVEEVREEHTVPQIGSSSSDKGAVNGALDGEDNEGSKRAAPAQAGPCSGTTEETGVDDPALSSMEGIDGENEENEFPGPSSSPNIDGRLAGHKRPSAGPESIPKRSRVLSKDSGATLLPMAPSLRGMGPGVPPSVPLFMSATAPPSAPECICGGSNRSTPRVVSTTRVIRYSIPCACRANVQRVPLDSPVYGVRCIATWGSSSDAFAYALQVGGDVVELASVEDVRDFYQR